MIQFYKDKNRQRFFELVDTLCTNMENPHIDQIHLLQSIHDNNGQEWTIDDFKEFENVYKKFNLSLFEEKIVLVNMKHEGRMYAGDAFRYASVYLRGSIAILANSDIYFDDSLGLIHSEDADLNQYLVYILSRYEKPENEHVSIGTQCGSKYIGSGDSFIFLPPLPSEFLKKCDFEIGSWGIESRILWEMEQVCLFAFTDREYFTL